MYKEEPFRYTFEQSINFPLVLFLDQALKPQRMRKGKKSFLVYFNSSTLSTFFD